MKREIEEVVGIDCSNAIMVSCKTGFLLASPQKDRRLAVRKGLFHRPQYISEQSSSCIIVGSKVQPAHCCKQAFGGEDGLILTGHRH